MIRQGSRSSSPSSRRRAGGRLVAALAAMLVLHVAAAAPAPAQTYGPQPVTLSCSVTLSGGVTRIGCTASGFARGAVLAVSISPGVDLGSIRVDDNGTASIDRALPAGLAPGDHTVLAVGVAADGRTATASTIVTIPGGVLAADATRSTTLPRTGSSALPLAGAGSALVAAGGLLVLTARKRRTRRRAPLAT